MAKTSLAERSSLPFLEILAGGAQGEVYDLVASHISIGRSDENDIVVQSEAVSRKHAVVEQVDGQWYIRDNGSKNGLVINGTPVRDSALTHGDVVQVGNFVFRFTDPAAPEMPAPQVEMPMEPAGALPSGYGNPRAVAAKPKRKVNKRLLIYGGAALLLAVVYLQSQEPEKKADDKNATVAADGTTTSKLARDFKLSPEPNLDNKADPSKLVGIEDPVLKNAEQQMQKLDWTNSSLRESEQYFKKGQREYLNKNFGRAIEAFQTALTLYRGHELAEKYLRLAIYEAEAEAKKQMEVAVRYFESLQYQRAMYHFSEVINLMAHRPSESIVGESEKYIALCKKRLQAAELFP